MLATMLVHFNARQKCCSWIRSDIQTGLNEYYDLTTENELDASNAKEYSEMRKKEVEGESRKE